MYTNSWDPNPGAIIRSSDKGATWASTDLPFKVGGNMPGRGMGERLAVDPHNSKILYFGARSGNGLWKSTDGGVTWAKVSSFTATGTFAPDPSDTSGLNNDKMGLAFVTFDSTSTVTNGATSRIFVGTADNITASVYVSNDAGATWSAVAGQPKKYFPHKCRLQPDEKALYLTYSDGTGPYDGTSGAVYRYDIAAGTWKDITPASGGDLYFGFGGLGLDMQKPGTLVVATLNSWYPDAQLFRSTDSGTTWSKIWEWTNYPSMNWYYGLHTDNAPWINAGFVSQDTKRLGWMIEALEIDPLDSDHWLYGTGLTLYGGHDLTKWDTVHNVSISSLAVGIEEMAVLGLASAPGGTELLAAVGDDCGFTFKSSSDLGTSPKTPWMNPMWTSSTDVGEYIFMCCLIVVRHTAAADGLTVPFFRLCRQQACKRRARRQF
jgi:xyloglucan-specific exo-beta-1,4-glucanase